MNRVFVGINNASAKLVLITTVIFQQIYPKSAN